MKQFRYNATDAGLTCWPQGELRLEGIEMTDDPAQADVFVVPGALTTLFPTRESLYRLPHFRGNEAKHVLFDCSDNEPLYGLPCMFIRCNTRSWYLDKDPNTISWPWPVDDFSQCIDPPADGFKFDVSFHGWLSSDTRKKSVQSCADQRSLKCDIAGYSDFTGYIYEQPEGIRRRGEFRRSMRESRVALCPESIPGVFPYRFFEAMSAARVPVLVSSEYDLPFEDEIPYESFSLLLSRASAKSIGAEIRKYLDATPDDELIRRGKLARLYWQKYLHRDDWPRLMAYAVKTKIGVGVEAL